LINPSPQTRKQIEGTPEQAQPISTWHVAEQPSVSIVFPSSQISFGVSINEFPHILQVEGLPWQVQPVSTRQVEEQPSPFIRF